MRTGVGGWGDGPQAKEKPGGHQSRKKRGRTPSPGVLRETSPAATLDCGPSDLQNQERGRFCCFKSCGSKSLVTEATRNRPRQTPAEPGCFSVTWSMLQGTQSMRCVWKVDCVPGDVSLCPGGGGTFVRGGAGPQASRLPPPGLRLPPCWVCSRRRGADHPHPGTLSWVSVVLLSPDLIMQRVLARGDHGASPASGCRRERQGCCAVRGYRVRAGPCAQASAGVGQTSQRRPRSLLTMALRLRLTLRGVSDLGHSWAPKQEGRQTFGQSGRAREAGPRTHPKEVHLPPAPRP